MKSRRIPKRSWESLSRRSMHEGRDGSFASRPTKVKFWDSGFAAAAELWYKATMKGG